LVVWIDAGLTSCSIGWLSECHGLVVGFEDALFVGRFIGGVSC